MPPKPSANRHDPAKPRRGRKLTLLLLAATAAVLAVAGYLILRPPHDPSLSGVPDPGPSQARRTRSAIESLLAKADAIAPAAGTELLKRRQEAYAAACELAKRFIQMEDRNDIVVRPVLARAQIRLGQFAEAERTIDDLLRLSAQSPEGLWLKGELVRHRGGKRYAEFFRMAAASEQAGAAIWARYGMELLAEGDDAAAGKWLTKARKAGLDDVQVRVGLAMLALRANRFAEAEQLLTPIARQPAAGSEVRSMLAEAQKNAGKLAPAEQTLREALKAGQTPRLWLQLGEVLLLQRRHAEAADAFAQAADGPLPEPAAAFRAARCYYLAGRYSLAMKYIDRAAELEPGQADVLEWLKKIEDARFGSTAATPTAPSLMLPPASALPPPTTQSADANTLLSPARVP